MKAAIVLQKIIASFKQTKAHYKIDAIYQQSSRRITNIMSSTISPSNQINITPNSQHNRREHQNTSAFANFLVPIGFWAIAGFFLSTKKLYAGEDDNDSTSSPQQPFTTESLAAKLSKNPYLLDFRNCKLTSKNIEQIRQLLESNFSVLRIFWPSGIDENTLSDILSRNHSFYTDKPSDYLYAYFSKLAYEDDGGIKSIPDGWRLLDKVGPLSDSYFGAAYVHDKSRHIIIAHRGTDPAKISELFKDLLTDVEGVIGRAVTSQQIAALNFSKKIRDQYSSKQYTVSFAGHSLGGYLAQICTYHFEKDGYHSLAVVIDSPGAYEALDALQPREDVYRKVNLDSLNITTYLAPPNLVNTCNTHLGIVYRVYPKLEIESLFEKFIHNFLYTVHVHSSKGIVALFDSVSGLPRAFEYNRVSSWPQIAMVKPSGPRNLGPYKRVVEVIENKPDKSEYKGFHHFASLQDNYKPKEDLSFEDLYVLNNKYHYQLREVDHYELEFRQLSSEVKNFLLDYDAYARRTNFLEKIDKQGIDKKEFDLLKYYSVNHEQHTINIDPACKLTAAEFRMRVTRLIKMCSDLLTSKKNYEDRIIQVFNQKPYASAAEQSLVILQAMQREADVIWKKSHELLYDLTTIGIQARLYLYAEPSPEELLQDASIVKQLHERSSQNLNFQSKLEYTIAKNSEQDTALFKQLLEDLKRQGKIINLAYLLKKAALHYKERNYTLSENLLNQCLRNVTENADFAYYNINPASLIVSLLNFKAKIARSTGNYEACLENYNKALTEEPDNAVLLSSKAASINDLGFYDNNLSKHAEAIALHTTAFKLNPKHPIVMMNYARGLQLLAYSKLKKVENALAADKRSPEDLLEDAEDFLTICLKTNPKNITAYLFRGITRMEKNNNEEALSDFEQALILQEDHPTLLRRKAMVLQALGKYEEALSTFKEAKIALKAKPWIPEQAVWLKEIEMAIENIRCQLKQHSQRI